MSSPTPTMLACLRLAAVEPLAYFRGGWYAPLSGRDQQAPRIGFAGEHVPPASLRACVVRGWLNDSGPGSIYARRWTITEEGRRVIQETEKGE